MRTPEEEQEWHQRLLWSKWSQTYYRRHQHAILVRKRKHYKKNSEAVRARTKRYREEIKRLA